MVPLERSKWLTRDASNVRGRFLSPLPSFPPQLSVLPPHQNCSNIHMLEIATLFDAGENEGCNWQLTVGTYHYYEGHGTSDFPRFPALNCCDLSGPSRKATFPVEASAVYSGSFSSNFG